MPSKMDKEVEGLIEMNRLRKEWLDQLGDSPDDLKIKKFLESEVDDEFLLRFLIGRKFNPEYAIETLKRYVDVKLIKYPEMFPKSIPSKYDYLRGEPLVGVLKARDESTGGRIFVFDTTYWDIKAVSLLELGKFGTLILEKLIKDEDCIRNGVTLIQDSSNMGIKQCAQYSLKALQQILAVYWHAYPIRYNALYYINTPKMLWIALNLAKYCFPKKLADRIIIWRGNSNGYDALHEIFPKSILPTFLKGDLQFEDAIEPEFAISNL